MEESTSQILDAVNQRIVSLLPWWESNLALRAIILVVLSVIVARATDWVLGFLIRRWVRRTTSTIDDKLLDILHRPIFTSVLVFGLWLTARGLDFPEQVRFLTFAILSSLLILLWFFTLGRLATTMLSAMADSEDIRMVKRDTLPLFENFTKIALFGAATYMLIVTWRANVTGWLASAGIVGIAVGFAARDTLANLFAGVFIFADAPYRIGDFVNLDSGERGEVTHIGLRSTRLITRDDVEITIPNSVIANAKIVNESGGPSPRYRLRIKVGVAYGSDSDRVESTLLEVAKANELVVEDPAPRVRFRAFGESSLDYELLCWVSEPVLRGLAIHQLNTAVYKQFAEHGVEIPFPQRDLYVKQFPEAADRDEG